MRRPLPKRGQGELFPAAQETRPAQPTVLQVTEAVALARECLEGGLGLVWVEGEVSNFKPAASGHLYFTIKDAAAQLRVVLFRSQAHRLRFRLEDGIAVVVRGKLTVYDARGDFQLSASHVDPVGRGGLAVAFDQLKQRLAADGLFASERKRPLPRLPRAVGVVTSPSGAALRDIVNVLGRRQAGVRIVLAAVPVQGEGAGAAIADAIDRLGQLPGLDVLIVGRGGGSAEDLWAFNEEVVARAIARSPLPVVSAVGHETDITISDLVADHRAPTPSAAAELVAASKGELRDRLAQLGARLSQAQSGRLERDRLRLVRASSARPLRRVESLPGRCQQRVDDLHTRLLAAANAGLRRRRSRLAEMTRALAQRDVRARLARQHRRLDGATESLSVSTLAGVSRRRAAVATLAGRLHALSPLAVLDRGYALVTTPDGDLIRRAQDLTPRTRIEIRFADGRVPARILGPDPEVETRE